MKGFWGLGEGGGGGGGEEQGIPRAEGFGDWGGVARGGGKRG